MGKLKGIVQFTGHFDGLSFYEVQGKIVVRKTGGFDGEKIKKDSNYTRVRENSSEFAHSAKVGKYFRASIAPQLLPLRLPYIHNRIVSLFQGILKFDLVHSRGDRTVGTGLQTVAGKKTLLDFEFDKTQTFSSIFPFKMHVDFIGGTLSIVDFCANTINSPKSADRIELQLHTVVLDFDIFTTPVLTSSSIFHFDIANKQITDLIVPIASGITLAVLEINFLQQINGNTTKLKGGGIKIVGVQI